MVQILVDRSPKSDIPDIHDAVGGQSPFRTTLKSWLNPLFVGIYRGSEVVQDFVHLQYDPLFFVCVAWDPKSLPD